MNSSASNRDWETAFSTVAIEMYTLLGTCRRRALLACSTVNPRHPLPADHQDLVMTEQGHAPSRRAQRVSRGRRVRLFARTVAVATRETLVVAAVQIMFRRRLRTLSRRPGTILIKTWFFGAPKADGPDFYLGKLPQLIRDRGVSCLLIGGDASYGAPVAFAADLLSSGRQAIPEQALVPWWAPAACCVDQLRTSWALGRLAGVASSRTAAAVALRASQECLSPAALKHALHFYIAKRAVAIWRPSVYGTLYEGHPWEKLAWLGAKTSDPACRIMGFQHTVVMPHSWGLMKPRRDSWEVPAPDIVLGVGRTTVSMMVPGHRDLGTAFAVLGAFRRTPVADDERSPVPMPATRTVLVAPEGFMTETALLFERAAQAAIAAPDQQFIFRCHPAWPFERVLPSLSVDVAGLPNVELSVRPEIADDFSRSSVVLYRGSSVVIYGVLAGLKAVYFNEPGRPYVDPLWRLDAWRDSVDSVPQLVATLRAYGQEDAETARAAWEPARSFADAYSVPVTDAAVDNAVAVMRG